MIQHKKKDIIADLEKLISALESVKYKDSRKHQFILDEFKTFKTVLLSCNDDDAINAFHQILNQFKNNDYKNISTHYEDLFNAIAGPGHLKTPLRKKLPTLMSTIMGGGLLISLTTLDITATSLAFDPVFCLALSGSILALASLTSAAILLTYGIMTVLDRVSPKNFKNDEALIDKCDLLTSEELIKEFDILAPELEGTTDTPAPKPAPSYEKNIYSNYFIFQPKNTTEPNYPDFHRRHPYGYEISLSEETTDGSFNPK